MRDMTLETTTPLEPAAPSDLVSGDYRPSEDEPQLREEDMRLPDQSDWASAEIQRSFELRTRDRERKLLNKIDAALKRIEDGSYGYCEETQEPIGVRRLEARPIATLSIEAQERHERRERVYRED